MRFRETAAVYCENHTEHTDTVRTSQETHYVSATKPDMLMLFGETVAVYCENHTEHRYSSYLRGNTLQLRYRARTVNVV
jgi:ribosomal protein L44E